MGLKERLIVAGSVIGAVFLVAPATFASVGNQSHRPVIEAGSNSPSQNFIGLGSHTNGGDSEQTGPSSSSHPNVPPSNALKLGISVYNSQTLHGTAVVHNVPPPTNKVEIFWFSADSQTPTSPPSASDMVGSASNQGKYTDVPITLSSSEASTGYLRAYAANAHGSNWSQPLALPIAQVPDGQLPEVPYAAGLPLIALGAFGIYRLQASRRRIRQAG
ncbi:hypothetical protein BXT84_15115 [Sulfobacillus thermotolerans]|uniref:Uncharacterized protein n=1 Tax=Sulfobacillus thermotolerans TaxID=338644 RepID=A0ABN5H797_9FIRM|nr:hypothetical protein BXT84_15115 [Sulfobacillus thermotolerans]